MREIAWWSIFSDNFFFIEIFNLLVCAWVLIRKKCSNIYIWNHDENILGTAKVVGIYIEITTKLESANIVGIYIEITDYFALDHIPLQKIQQHINHARRTLSLFLFLKRTPEPTNLQGYFVETFETPWSYAVTVSYLAFPSTWHTYTLLSLSITSVCWRRLKPRSSSSPDLLPERLLLTASDFLLILGAFSV